MFYPFLVAVTPTEPATLSAIFKELMPYASLIFSGWVYYKNGNKEEAKQLQEVLKNLQLEVAEHSLKHQAAHQALEHLADSTSAKFVQVEQRVNQVDQVLTKVQGLEIRLGMQNEQIAKLDKAVEKLGDKLDKFLELMTKK